MVIPIWFLDLSKILSWSLFAVRLSLFVVMIRVVSLRCDHTNRDYFVTKIITVFSILMTLRLKMTSSMARLRNEKCKRNKMKRYVIRKRKECNKMEFTRYQNIYWFRQYHKNNNYFECIFKIWQWKCHIFLDIKVLNKVLIF